MNKVDVQNQRFVFPEKSGYLGFGPHELPLHNAAWTYNLPKIRSILLSRTIDPNAKDAQGNSAIHILLKDGFRGRVNEPMMLECLKELVVAGRCEINERNKVYAETEGEPILDDGETPLSLAVKNEFESCALFLVEKGADTTVKTQAYPRNHSLATEIAIKMPAVMMAMFDGAVSVKNKTTCESVVFDWRPILQFNMQTYEQDKVKRWFAIKRHEQRETSFLYSLLDVPLEDRESYLKHPLVTAFLHIKDTKVANLLRIMQTLLSIFPLAYMAYIYFLYFESCNLGRTEANGESSSTTTQEPEPANTARCSIPLSLHICSYLLLFVIIGYVSVEIFMLLAVEESRSFKNWRSWVARFSICVMSLTIYPGLRVDKDDYNITWQYPIAALGIFLAWVMFLFQLELVPKVKIYLEMLVSIIISGTKITLLFLPLMFAFFMGFNLIYSDVGGLSSFVQMTLDFGSSDYENMKESMKIGSRYYAAWANVFSVIFIIVIGIVFMNFLLGYAISDIQDLKQKAAVMTLSNRVQSHFIGDVFTSKDDVVPIDKFHEKFEYTFDPERNEHKFDSELMRELTDFLKWKYSPTKTTPNESEDIS